MIRKYEGNDITAVIQIWLDTNVKAHSFIPKEYWIENHAAVKEMLPQAELYVYEDDKFHQIIGFIGMIDNYIAGIFVAEGVQSKGIGRQLLNYAKEIKSALSLSVYQKNVRAVSFYQREHFIIQSENMNEATNEREFIMIWNQ